MNIFNLISENYRRGPVTLPFPERHEPQTAYRGPVVMETDKCLACGICDYVCVSGAISVKAFDDHFEWTYDLGRCTFCGRCVDHCPGDALTQECDHSPSYAVSGDLRLTETVMYPACPECGRPALPFNEHMLPVAFSEVTEQLRERIHLCDRCRLKLTQRELRKGYVRMPEEGDANNDR